MLSLTYIIWIMYRAYRDNCKGVLEDGDHSENPLKPKNGILDECNKQDLDVQDVIKERWQKQQERMREQLILEDTDDWSRHRITPDNREQYPSSRPLEYIGGVDISFVKGDNINACAAFVVLNFPELEVVYEDLSMVQLTAPYIPGFLAFREADFLIEKIEKLKGTRPDLTPQIQVNVRFNRAATEKTSNMVAWKVILVDGNGILHYRGFGLACQLGVLADIPTIGLAKNLLCVDGLERNEDFHEKITSLKEAGDSFPLVGKSGKQHGVAFRSSDDTTNPVYVSPGHKISMYTAVWVTQQCTKYRVAEPTRQADIRSREYLRLHWMKETKKVKTTRNRTKHKPQIDEKYQRHHQKKTRSDEESEDDDFGDISSMFDEE